MITLWGRNNSTNVKKVLWTLEELDLPFNQIMAGMSFGVNKEADYLAMNPNGLVPLLRDVRNAGLSAEVYPDAVKMKKQMEYANRRGIPMVVIVGSEELAAGVATVKEMLSGEQRQVPFAELAAVLQ